MDHNFNINIYLKIRHIIIKYHNNQIFLSMHTILLSNTINHIIYISNYLIKQLKNIIMLLITFL